MGFVFAVNIVAEGFAFGIKNHHHLGFWVILGKALHHADYAFDGVGVQAFGVGQ